jgi:glycosyltransferase involved in cell wall biosynthesis
VAAKLQIAHDPAPGVNLVGPFDSRSGLGEAARMLARAVEHAGIPFVAISYGDSSHGGSDESIGPSSEAVPYDTNVLCLQPDQLRSFANEVGVAFFSRRTNIGFWFWESTVFPDYYVPELRLLDRLWVPSQHVRGVMIQATSAPVHVIPIPVVARSVEMSGREELGLPREGFVFLALFDLVSARRKNPQAVIDAFRTAFPPGAGAQLVIKTINGHDREPRHLRVLQEAASGRDDITVLDGYVSARERDTMLAACDCFVSLHRAEGLGLPMLEAMCLGKPVIATGFSGNLDFMDDEGSYLVPFRLVPVPTGEWGHSEGALWAEPSVEVAAARMRQVFDAPDEARLVAEVGRNTVLARYSLERSAVAVATELEAARVHPQPVVRERRRRSIVDASLLLARDPTLVGRSGRGPSALVRRVLVRALWPQLSDQRRRDDAMLQGLTDLERSLARLEKRVEADGGADDCTRRAASQLSANRVGASSSSSDPENS